jgi:hypothetical protein
MEATLVDKHGESGTFWTIRLWTGEEVRVWGSLVPAGLKVGDKVEVELGRRTVVRKIAPLRPGGAF